jgi:hypothetical protein
MLSKIIHIFDYFHGKVLVCKKTKIHKAFKKLNGFKPLKGHSRDF